MAPPVQPTTARALTASIGKAIEAHAKIAEAAVTAAERLQSVPGGPPPETGRLGQLSSQEGQK